MKKLFALFALLALVFTASACSYNECEGESRERQYEKGEWPPMCTVCFPENYSTYKFNVGDVTDQFHISFTHNPDLYQGKEDYDFDITSEDEAILKIESFDKDQLMDTIPSGGLTVKCISPGTTRIKLTMVYLPTGGTYTTYATVTVVDPASTQPAETAS